MTNDEIFWTVIVVVVVLLVLEIAPLFLTHKVPP